MCMCVITCVVLYLRVARHDTLHMCVYAHYFTCLHADIIMYLCFLFVFVSAQQYTHTCSPTVHHSNIQHSVHLYKLLGVSCIDHVPPYPQDGLTPLMLAAGLGHLPVARLLVETYHCDVNEESGWEVKGGVSEYSTCVSSHM